MTNKHIKQGGFWDAIGDSGRFLKSFLVDQPAELFGLSGSNTTQGGGITDTERLAMSLYNSQNQENPFHEIQKENPVKITELVNMFKNAGLSDEDAHQKAIFMMHKHGDKFVKDYDGQSAWGMGAYQGDDLQKLRKVIPQGTQTGLGSLASLQELYKKKY